MPNDDLKLSKRQLKDAAHAWDVSGSLGLGLWLSRHKPHFSTKDYADLVALVRAELGDDTDYSREGLAMYLMWFDDNAKTPLAQRIAAGRQTYIDRYGVAPSYVLMSEADYEQRIELQNMIALFKPFIRRNNYWFGMSDC